MLFDFDQVYAAPVSVRLRGVQYNLPRFLLPEMSEWCAERRKERQSEATAHLTADEKARFITYFEQPRVDVFSVKEYARSPEGAPSIVRRQLKAAGVPDDVQDFTIKNADPEMVVKLAVELTSAAKAAESAQGMTEPEVKPGESADPLPVPPAESAGSPGIGQTSEPTSKPATAA